MASVIEPNARDRKPLRRSRSTRTIRCSRLPATKSDVTDSHGARRFDDRSGFVDALHLVMMVALGAFRPYSALLGSITLCALGCTGVGAGGGGLEAVPGGTGGT